MEWISFEKQHPQTPGRYLFSDGDYVIAGSYYGKDYDSYPDIAADDCFTTDLRYWMTIPLGPESTNEKPPAFAEGH